MKKTVQKSNAQKFDLKMTGPFTPREAAARLKAASQRLKGFQLWHPQMHLAHERFSLPDVKYPIAVNTIPAGLVISQLASIEADPVPPPAAAGLIRPFRNSEKMLAQVANMHLSVTLYKTTPKQAPAGVRSLEIISEPGKGLRLQARGLHNDIGGAMPAETRRDHIAAGLGSSARNRWVLLGTEDVYIKYPTIRRAESTLEIAFASGDHDGLERILQQVLEIHPHPVSASWWVDFENTFYHRVYDETQRWFYFPKPEMLTATGLSGQVSQLIDLVNRAGFPGANATLTFDCSFNGLEHAHTFFEMAARNEADGDGIDRALLAMFQTEKGAFAQLCFGTKRGGKIFLKPLYSQRGGFGWEYAYEKLLRGEKLI